MKRFQNFSTSRLIRFASTALTVTLLITLRVETPCSLEVPPSAHPTSGTARNELSEFCSQCRNSLSFSYRRERRSNSALLRVVTRAKEME